MRRGPRLSGPAGPLLGVAVGLLAAAVVTLLQESTYRADASIVLVRAGQPPGSDPALAQATEAAAELFDSRAVAESAIRNLGLDETPSGLVDRLDVDAQEGSSLLRISATAPSAEEARRTAQEASEVATVLFNDRFAPQTVASIWEPASAEPGRISPTWSRNLALGALIGALAGFGLVLLGQRERAPRPDAEPAPKPMLEPRAAAAPRPDPQPESDARAPSTGPFVLPGFGQWTIADVERLLAEQGPAFPELQDELQLYLETFRGVAGPDGHLPGDVDLVLEDVFAPLLARSRTAR
jgi:capsular polysaccharide biosynthesis protein